MHPANEGWGSARLPHDHIIHAHLLLKFMRNNYYKANSHFKNHITEQHEHLLSLNLFFCFCVCVYVCVCVCVCVWGGGGGGGGGKRELEVSAAI